MGNVFDVDPEGFREQNAGRPPAHLVRETIQNVFDEQSTQLDVTVKKYQDGVHVIVEDDVDGGIRDPKLIFTIWLSDKKDSPVKRGRMGRGLKELVSVADRTTIVTQGQPAIVFKRDIGTEELRRDHPVWSRSTTTTKTRGKGTKVECIVRGWTEEDVQDIEQYLRQMRPPGGLEFRVNGHLVPRRSAKESYELALPTVLYEEAQGERIARDRKRQTTVDLFEQAEPWIYEMGVPVEPIDYPLSVDVAQRIPLRERRDTITEPYRKELFAKLLDKRIDKIEPEQFKDGFVLTAAQSAQHLSPETKQKIANAYTEGLPYAVSPESLRQATGMHIRAVPLRSMPQPIRDIVKEVGQDVKAVVAEVHAVTCKPVDKDEMRPYERAVKAVFEWIAAGIKKPCTVLVKTGRPSFNATFDRAANVLTIFRENVGSHWFTRPFGAEQLSLLCHELAHWTKHDDSHGFDFHSDSEDIGGAMAAFLFANAPEGRAIEEAALDRDPPKEN